MSITINGTTGLAGIDGSASTPTVQGTDTNTGIFFPAADTVAVATGGSERLRVDSSGDVGIGTSSPAAALHVNSGLANLAGLFESTDAGATITLIDDSTTGGSVAEHGLNTVGDELEVRAVSTLAFETAATERMRIDSSGNVGIGTTSPSAVLHVLNNEPTVILDDANNGTGGTAYRPHQEFWANGTRVGSIGMTDSSNLEIIADNYNSASINFDTGGSERMRITSAGDVNVVNGDILVGTDSGDPFNGSSRIKIQDVGSSYIQIKSDATGTVGLLFGDTTDDFTAGIQSYQTDGNNLTFHAGNASRMEITSTGEVVMPDVYSDTVTGRDLYISSTGKLGYVSSTRASKTNIQDLSDVSWLYSLNPVSFQYRVRNKDDTYSADIEPQQEYGLIAEDVELVNPDLVFYDETENGRELRGIQYSRLIAPLLKAIQEQQSLITDLTARVAELEAK